MVFSDLREFISKIEEWGEVQVIEGADWDREIGAVHDLVSSAEKPPLLVFDKIKGYKAGYRVATQLFSTPKRTALALGLPPQTNKIEMVKAVREKIKDIKPLPPVEVKTGPVKENVFVGDDVDLFMFPTPIWRESNPSGRFIGTGSAVITRDPDTGWTNLGAYRCQIVDKTTATVSIVPGHHGNVMRQKYWDRGMNCPMAVCCGQEPALWAASHMMVPWGISEYDFAGGLRGEPVQVTRGVTTDLLIPATAEIVLEGEVVPYEEQTIMEPCLGEWHGYLNPPKPLPAFRVKSILHRNNPIIHGAPPAVKTATWTLGSQYFKSANLWNQLDTQLPAVKGVWMMDEGGQNMMVAISLQQQYPGHAKQAALIAAGCLPTAYMCKYIIVVDDDVDPSDTFEVLWAIATRAEPETSIDVVRGLWGSVSNVLLTDEQRKNWQLEHSTALIVACKPFHRIKSFPVRVKTSAELAQRVKDKWPELLQYLPR